MTQRCGHPLSARMIEVIAVGPRAEDRRLQTVCWACKIERQSTQRHADQRENR